MTYSDYAAALATLAEQIKNDKDIVQPQRNYAAKLVVELQAMLLLGLSTTNRTYGAPGATAVDPNQITPEPYKCTCPTGGLRRDCPVHGKTA